MQDVRRLEDRDTSCLSKGTNLRGRELETPECISESVATAAMVSHRTSMRILAGSTHEGNRIDCIDQQTNSLGSLSIHIIVVNTLNRRAAQCPGRLTRQLPKKYTTLSTNL